MALYGDQDQVEILLRGAPSITLNVDFEARFAEVQVLVSSWLEQSIGKAFGGGPTSASARVYLAGPTSSFLLPVPARTITAIKRFGTWDGVTYANGTALTASDYITDPIDRFGVILGLRLVYGGAWGYGDRFGRPTSPIQITGTWSDTTAEGVVPEDLTAIANYLIAERYKALQASPAGFVGPDGTVVPIRNPFKDPAVLAIVDKYRIQPVPAF